jgi:prepilin-type processing-associated H-X9-DG protein
MSNSKQLGLACLMYANDNNDNLPINSDGSAAYNGSPSWINGWMDWFANPTSANTNTDNLINDKYSLLGNNLGRNYKVFACPGANSVSAAQRKLGWDHRVRSVAMSGACGDGAKYNFGWSNWHAVKKSTGFRTPGPSDVWMFIDEHPDSIDDGILYTPNKPVSPLIEIPGCQHDGACGIAFADGHSEIHKWKGKFSNKPVTHVYTIEIAIPLTDPDLIWLAQHTPVN